MRGTVVFQFPTGFVSLKRALDFWENEGQWDAEGFDWINARNLPHRLRTALIDGRLTAWVMSEEGRFEVVPVALWRGTYLWGDVYSTGLVDVQLDGYLLKGYLCVDQAAVNKLWRAQSKPRPQPAPLEQASVDALLSECPPLGLVLQAVVFKVDTRNAKDVQNWLRNVWPESLHEVWPTRIDVHDEKFPSLARQISTAIRTFNAIKPKWKGLAPDEPTFAALVEYFPVIAAAFAVFRGCKQGELDCGPQGIVLPRKTEAAIRALLDDTDLGAHASRLFKALARLAIPVEKVSGGGRLKAQTF